MSRQASRNYSNNTYFIDCVRFSALTPYCAKIPESGIIKSKNNLWYAIETEKIPANMYLSTAKELTRYEDNHYYAKWEFASPTWQNNIQPYSASSAMSCITDVFQSYKKLSSWAKLAYYLTSIRIIYLETGVDFTHLRLPSIAQLKEYVSHGRGSSPRNLKLVTSEQVYIYNKSISKWNVHIDDKSYNELLNGGKLTAYIGSRNIQFKIYKKGTKIRVELAIRGRAQVLKFLNFPLCKEPSRHITKLADYWAIKHLSSAYLDRLQELFGGRLPRGAAEAVNRALASFKTTPMPQAWEKTEKQEPILPLNLFVQKEEPAIDINADRQARAIDGVGRIRPLTCINKVFLMPFFVRFVCLNSPKVQRARAPPFCFSWDFSIFTGIFGTFLIQHSLCCYCCFIHSLPKQKMNRQIFSNDICRFPG